MATGELNLHLTSPSPQAPAPAPEGDSLPPLPEPLHAVGKSLISAVADDHLVAQAFAAFCSAAYVKPDWAGAASEFLAELFAEQEDLLAELARIPDLIIELASGHITLTCMVAARWAARGETNRLARLAEALITTQSKMSGSVAVVEIMLALATSLAITRYSRAEQLLHAAEPQASADQQDALVEARLWLAAGRIVRGSSQEIRDLWDQRLRRSRQTWSWESPDERDALLQLADHLDEGPEGLTLFEAVVPSAWWDLATLRAKELSQPAPEPEPAPPPRPSVQPVSVPTAHLRLPASFAGEAEQDNLTHLPWSPMPFLAGMLMGAMSLTAFIWLAQPRWATRPHVAASAPVPAAQPGKAAPDDAGLAGGKSAPPAADADANTAPSATAAAATPAPSSSAAVGADATTPAVSHAEWRANALEALTKEEPALAPLAAAAKHGTWAENEAVLKGETLSAPRILASYQKLLLWLHLDPPEDPEVRAKIPNLLVELRADDPVLDLWKKLIYDGSPNANDVRNAAKQQIHNNASAWSPAQRNTLMEIAGWGVASAGEKPEANADTRQ